MALTLVIAAPRVRQSAGSEHFEGKLGCLSPLTLSEETASII